MTPTEFVSRLPCHLAPQLKARFTPDCCLNATRIVLEVARLFGIKGGAVEVDTAVMNDAFFRMMQEHGSIPDDVEILQRWDAQGAWSLLVDYTLRDDDPPNKWAGHLVAVIDGRFLVDASARQFVRPEKKVELLDVIVSDGKMPFVWKDTRVFYATRKSRTHERTSGFERSPWNLEVAAEVAESMKAEGL